MQDAQPLCPATAHKVFRRQMLFFAVLLSVSALDNTYTALADRAREGDLLPFWKPLVWEVTSNLGLWLLVPALAWWLAKFPFARQWGQQLVHHDLWDYDLASQPTLVDLVHDGKRVAAVIQATKTGFLFTFDRDSGAPLFPIVEKPVPAREGIISSPTRCRADVQRSSLVYAAARIARWWGLPASQPAANSTRSLYPVEFDESSPASAKSPPAFPS
jgi:hypothetical protein